MVTAYNISEEHTRSARARLLTLLWDLQWHHNRELRVAGNRYSARMLELRRLGYQIEKCTAQTGHQYRLISHEPEKRQGKMVKVYLPEEDAAAAAEDHRITELAAGAIKQALVSFRANVGRL